MNRIKLKNIVLAAVFLGIGLILPFFTGQIKEIGKMLLPMHIPVILCGLICGWPYGIVVGFILPLFRSLMFSMPMMYPNAAAMAFELASYGFFCGILYSPSKGIKSLYTTLLVSMAAGRIIWGLAEVVLLGISGSAFTFRMFIAGAFLEAVPGIILQLIVIPVIISALNKAKR